MSEGESQSGANKNGAGVERGKTEARRSNSERKAAADAQASRKMGKELAEADGSKVARLLQLAGIENRSKDVDHVATAKELRHKAMMADPAFQELQQNIFAKRRSEYATASRNLEDLEPGQLTAVRNEAIQAYLGKEKGMSNFLDRFAESDESYNAEFLRLTNEGVSAEKAEVLAREFARVKICTEDKVSGHKDQKGRDEMLAFYRGRKDVLGDPSYLAEFRQLTEAGATIEDARTIAFEHTKAKLAQEKAGATGRPTLYVVRGEGSASAQGNASNTSDRKAA